MELSLEQQFNIAAFEQQAREMSREQAIDLLIDLFRQTQLRENCYKSLLQQQWGIEKPLENPGIEGFLSELG